MTKTKTMTEKIRYKISPLDGLDCNNKKKSFNFTSPLLTQIKMKNIGHKSLPIILGSYVGDAQFFQETFL